MLLFMDSGDHVRQFSADTVQVSRKFESSDIGSSSSVAGYENGFATRGINGARLLKPFGSTKTTLFVHCKHRFSSFFNGSASSHNAGVDFLLGGSEQVSFKFREVDLASIDAGGRDGSVFEIQVFRGATLIATHGRFYTHYYYAFQFKVTPDTTTGAYEIRAAKRQGRFKEPMTVVGSGTGLNLANTGSDGCDQVRENHDTSGGQSEWCDLIVTDDVADGTIFDDFIESPRLVRAFYPDAVGADDEWDVQGTADKVDAVNEPSGNNNQVVEDGKRIVSEVIGDIQLFGFEDGSWEDSNVVGPAAGASIDMVIIYSEAAMESSGSRTYRALYRNLADTRSVGAGVVLGSTVFEMAAQQWAINPITAAPWTLQEIYDAQFGVEIVS